MNDLAPAGKRAKLDANLAALRTLRQIQAGRRPATPQEQAVLARWAGWGGLPEVFDPGKPQFAAERGELRGLLSQSEWNEARRNTLNAHYTDIRVADAMWQALQDLGFDDGRVLEPGSGAGTFIGRAPANADMVGVELDSTTAAISKALYPDATIRNESFADTRLPDGSFDATIGNVPYGKLTLRDRFYNRAGESIHNHFILKSIAMTRPGGVVMVLTSRHTLDAQGNERARRKMAEQADLIGAVRLPSGSHTRVAGTDVIEDILIFRKREPGQAPQADQSWIGATKVDPGDPRIAGTIKDRLKLTLSDYWAEHPENVLGQEQVVSGQYGTGDLEVIGDKDMPGLHTALAGIVAQAHDNGLTVPARQDALPDLLEPLTGRHEGHIQAEDGGGFTQAIGGASTRLDVPATQQAELRGLLGLRDTVTSLLDAESRTSDDTAEIRQLRADLNTQYDAYTAKYGPINRYKLTKSGARQRAPQGGFRDDPLSSVALALESTYTPAPDGKGTGTASKASIFTTRAVAPRQIRETADNPQDALTLSLERFGEVSLPEIARMLGTDEDTARARLGTLVFEIPPIPEGMTAADLRDLGAGLATDRARVPGELVSASEYLSGDVRRKLRLAQAAAIEDPKFDANVDSLQAAVPRDLGQDEIAVRIGAPWVPPSDYRAFLADLLQDPTVQVAAGGGIWKVTADRGGVLSSDTWGIPGKEAGSILETLLNQKQIRVGHTDRDGKYIPDPDATLAAKGKAEEMSARFEDWLWQDRDRAQRLLGVYNERFNGLALRRYEAPPGREYQGMTDFWQRRLRDHQKNAVERVTQSPATLLGHVVGAGKTATMATSAAELRRLGLSRKPAIVVPNHMLEQATREVLEIYPQAKVLAAGTQDLQGDKRREFVARAATGDWDLVIFTQGSFEAVPMSRDRIAEYMDRELEPLRRDLERAAAAAEGQDDKSAAKKTVKKMESTLLRAEERLKAKLDKEKDVGVSFEQTGIDHLFVDEFQDYLNLRTMSGIEGAGSVGSDKATDMHMKTEYLRHTSESGRHLTTATGTPIRNSVSQLYTLIRFHRPDLLESAGITTHDQWAATFGELTDDMELKPEGQGFRLKTRFSKFKNMPELLRMFHSFADIQTAEMLRLPTPDLKGGRPETVVVPRTDAQAAYIRDLGDRADAVRAGTVDKHDDNMLKISTDGRKAALSMRLVGGDHEDGKLEAAAAKIASIYQRDKDRVYTDEHGDTTIGALQIVFMDLGTPSSAKKPVVLEPIGVGDQPLGADANDSGWNGYDHLKAVLAEQHGVPADRIRFMQEANNDAAKAQIFADARAGKISVLIGSTTTMGVGTNVQKLAAAMHDIDAPWRPADVEQRGGRILRQGNLNAEVEMYRYVTEGSFDAYMWQTLERKAKFINQAIRGTLDVREMEDVGDTSLSFAEVKALATGNPDFLDKARADTHLAKLERLQRSHQQSQSKLRADIDYHQQTIKRQTADAAALRTLIAARDAAGGDTSTIRVDGITYDKRTDAGAALIAALQATAAGDQPRTVGRIAGLDIEVAPSGNAGVLVRLAGQPGNIWLGYRDDLNKQNPQTMGRTVAAYVGALDGHLRADERSIDHAETELGRARENVGKEFGRTVELGKARRKSARLALKLQRDAARAEGQHIPFDPVVDTDQFDDAEGDLPALPDMPIPGDDTGGGAVAAAKPARFPSPAAWRSHALKLAGEQGGGYGDAKKRGQYLTRVTKTPKNIWLSPDGGLVTVKDKTGKFDVLAAGVALPLPGGYTHKPEDAIGAFRQQEDAQAFADFLESTARNNDGNPIDWAGDDLPAALANYPKGPEFRSTEEWLTSFRADFDRARGIKGDASYGDQQHVHDDDRRLARVPARREQDALLARSGLDDRWEFRSEYETLPNTTPDKLRAGDTIVTEDAAGGGVNLSGGGYSADDLNPDKKRYGGQIHARTVERVEQTGGWQNQYVLYFTDGTKSSPIGGHSTYQRVTAHPDGFPGQRPPEPAPPRADTPTAPRTATDAVDRITRRGGGGGGGGGTREPGPARPEQARPEIEALASGVNRDQATRINGPDLEGVYDAAVADPRVVAAKDASPEEFRQTLETALHDAAVADADTNGGTSRFAAAYIGDSDGTDPATTRFREAVLDHATPMARTSLHTSLTPEPKPGGYIPRADEARIADDVNATVGRPVITGDDLAPVIDHLLTAGKIQPYALNETNSLENFRVVFDDAFTDAVVERFDDNPQFAGTFLDNASARDAILAHAAPVVRDRIRREHAAQTPTAPAPEPAARLADTVSGIAGTTITADDTQRVLDDAMAGTFIRDAALDPRNSDARYTEILAEQLDGSLPAHRNESPFAQAFLDNPRVRYAVLQQMGPQSREQFRRERDQAGRDQAVAATPPAPAAPATIPSPARPPSAPEPAAPDTTPPAPRTGPTTTEDWVALGGKTWGEDRGKPRVYFNAPVVGPLAFPGRRIGAPERAQLRGIYWDAQTGQFHGGRDTPPAVLRRVEDGLRAQLPGRAEPDRSPGPGAPPAPEPQAPGGPPATAVPDISAPGPGTAPPDTPLGRLSPPDQTRVRIAAEDWVGWHAALGRQDAVRYTTESGLKPLADRVGYPAARDAVAQYVDAHPDLLEQRLGPKERQEGAARRAADRAAQLKPVGAEAAAAFKAGRWDDALAAVDRGEQIDPDARDWGRLRDNIRRKQQEQTDLPAPPAAPPAPAAPEPDVTREQRAAEMDRQAREAAGLDDRWTLTGPARGYWGAPASALRPGDVIYTRGDGTAARPVELPTAGGAGLDDRTDKVQRTVERVEQVDGQTRVHFTDGTSTGPEGGSVRPSDVPGRSLAYAVPVDRRTAAPGPAAPEPATAPAVSFQQLALQARTAYLAGDHDRALALVDQAQQAAEGQPGAPDPAVWDTLRRDLTAKRDTARAATPATPAPPSVAPPPGPAPEPATRFPTDLGRMESSELAQHVEALDPATGAALRDALAAAPPDRVDPSEDPDGARAAADRFAQAWAAYDDASAALVHRLQGTDPDAADFAQHARDEARDLVESNGWQAPNAQQRAEIAAMQGMTPDDLVTKAASRDRYVRLAAGEELAARGYDGRGVPVLGGRAGMTNPQHPGDVLAGQAPGTRVAFRARSGDSADVWQIGEVRPGGSGGYNLVAADQAQQAADGVIYQDELDPRDWVEPVQPNDPRVAAAALTDPDHAQQWTTPELDHALIQASAGIRAMIGRGDTSSDRYQQASAAFRALSDERDRRDAAPGPADPGDTIPFDLAAGTDAAEQAARARDRERFAARVVGNPRLDEVQQRPAPAGLDDEHLDTERASNQDRMATLYRSGRGDGTAEFDALAARQQAISAEQEQRVITGVGRPVEDVPARQVQRRDRVVADLTGRAAVYEVTDVHRTGGTVRLELMDQDGRRQDYELSDGDTLMVAAGDADPQDGVPLGPTLDDVATDPQPGTPGQPEPNTPEPGTEPAAPAAATPQPPAPAPAGPGITPHAPGVAVARPVLYTYQRANINSLGLDLDASQEDTVRQAAARVRARQELSGAQTHALAEAVRARAGAGDLRPVQQRAMNRLAYRLDAATAQAEGGPPPDLPNQQVTPVKPGDLGAGDVVALARPRRGAPLVGRVVAVRSMMRGRLHEVTVERPDGTRETQLLTGRTDAYVLPDLPDPQSLPADPPAPEIAAAVQRAGLAASDQLAARGITRHLGGIAAYGAGIGTRWSATHGMPDDAPDIEQWLSGMEDSIADSAPSPTDMTLLTTAVAASWGTALPGVRSVAEDLHRRAARAAVTSMRAAVPGDGETRGAAVLRTMQFLADNPPSVGDLDVAGESLARTGVLLRDARAAAGPVAGPPAVPETAGTLAERIGQFRDALGDGFGVVPKRVPVPQVGNIGDLAAGRVPQIGWEEYGVVDRAPDGLPGETAMRHLDIVRAAGADLDTVHRRYMTEAQVTYPPGTVREGEHPEDALRRHQGELETLRQQMDAARVRRAEMEASGVSMAQARRDSGVSDLRDRRLTQVQQERDLREAVAAARREAALRALREAGVEFGGPGLDYWEQRPRSYRKLGDRNELVRAARWAEAAYPTAWLEALRGHLAAGRQPHGGLTLGTGDRGEYWNDGRVNLSSASSVMGTAADRQGDYRRTAQHELGHGMETAVPGLLAAESALMAARAATGRIGERAMQASTPIHGRQDETGPDDNFPDPYSGRRYPEDRNYELFTTAVEELLGGGSRGYLDDDLRQWVLGVLATVGHNTGR